MTSSISLCEELHCPCGQRIFDLSEEIAHELLEGGEFCRCWMVPRELRDEEGEQALKDSREEENDLEDWCAPAPRKSFHTIGGETQPR
jgi:hypothetical protein